jgi:ketosteroid isomerase-like protein
MPSHRLTIAAVGLTALLVSAATAGGQTSSGEPTLEGTVGQVSDSASVVATLQAFHRALRSGNADVATALLAPDLQVAESGGLENLEEYTSHHLPGDMGFAGAVDRSSTLHRVVVEGDVAWIMATSRTQGSYRDRDIDSIGVELVVFGRGEDGWLIRAIHWSSRRPR